MLPIGASSARLGFRVIGPLSAVRWGGPPGAISVLVHLTSGISRASRPCEGFVNAT
jgi:hypothetical protein